MKEFDTYLSFQKDSFIQLSLHTKKTEHIGKTQFDHLRTSIQCKPFQREARLTKIHLLLYFDLRTRPKMPFQGDAPEGSDTF